MRWREPARSRVLPYIESRRMEVPVSRAGALASSIILLIIAVAPAAAQQSAQSVLLTMLDRQEARWSGIENYALEVTVEGAPIPAPQYFEKDAVGGRTTFRLVPFAEWYQRGTGSEQLQPEHFQMLAEGFDMMAQTLRDNADPMMAAMVSDVMLDVPVFLRALAEVDWTDTETGEIPDAPNVQGIVAFAQAAQLVGREALDGRQAFLLRAGGLQGVQSTGDAGTLEIQTTSMWVDEQEYVPLRLLMEGTVEADGRSVPLTLEVLYQDYQTTGSLYLPGTQVMRMAGIMEVAATDPSQRRKLEEARREVEKARAEMARMEAELAKMPPAARRMVEGQMEKSLARLDMMLNEGVVEGVIHTRVIGVNTGPPVDWLPNRR